MKRIFIGFISGLLLISNSSFAASFQPKGYIQNDKGEKCWYTQKTANDQKYFYGKDVTSNNGIITFASPSCMVDSGAGMGLDINKMMINNTIARWYSMPDAKFQTRASELYKASPAVMGQTKGWCMQSKTYELQAVALDYIVHNNSIAKVVHGMAISCR